MAWFRGNFTKTMKNSAKALEIKSRVWALSAKKESIVDLIESTKEQNSRIKDILETEDEAVVNKAYEDALREINEFKI